jgi:branched-chain amino acid transport system ATP-binding protein
MSALLEVHGLAKAFGGVHAVRGVSFNVSAGEIVALIGPNGAGKSTCFNALNGQIRPDAGTIRLDGRDIAGWPPRDVWRLGVGRTFQITATFASMSVIENVQTVLLSHAGRAARLWGLATRAERDRAEALLALVAMSSQAERPAAELAYGDLKRLELAMALANEPQLLLMDEPTSGMSPRDRVEVMGLTAGIAREKNLGVLFTEHDMDVVFRHADRILVLSRGQLIAEGKPDEVRRNPEVQAVYLGEGLTYHDGSAR